MGVSLGPSGLRHAGAEGWGAGGEGFSTAWPPQTRTPAPRAARPRIPDRSPAAAERADAGKRSLSRKLGRAGSLRAAYPLWATRSTGSKWTLLSLRPRLPATECAAQILISGAPGTSARQGEHPLSFESRGGPKAQSLLTRHHARVSLLPPNHPRGSLPWPISVSWPLRPRGRSPPNVIRGSACWAHWPSAPLPRALPMGLGEAAGAASEQRPCPDLGAPTLA